MNQGPGPETDRARSPGRWGIKTARRNAVALATDARLFPAAAFAASRLVALNDRADTDVIVFSDAAVADLATSVGLPFSTRGLSVAAGSNLSPHYLRFFIPEALPSYDRILYLDTDTYAEDARLFRLFDLDMGEHVFAGVRDAVIAFVPGSDELSSILGPGNTRYMNSGVMLIEAARYRRERTLRDILKRTRGKQRGFHLDQSALNLTLRGNFLELSPAFNLMTPLWNSFVRKAIHPAIVHFTGVMKPWRGPSFLLDHPARSEMEKYFPTSPWPGFLPGFFGLREALAQSPQQVAPSFDAPFGGKPEFLAYLRATDFADVSAGLTVVHFDRLPDAA